MFAFKLTTKPCKLKAYVSEPRRYVEARVFRVRCIRSLYNLLAMMMPNYLSCLNMSEEVRLRWVDGYVTAKFRGF